MSGLVYHQRKLKVNTFQIGNQKKKLITRKKKSFPYQSQCMVQFTKRKLGANEVHKIGDMKSLVWGGGGCTLMTQGHTSGAQIDMQVNDECNAKYGYFFVAM